MVESLRSSLLYGTYWLSFYAVLVGWGLVNIALQRANLGARAPAAIGRLQFALRLYCLVFLVLAPLIVDIHWWWTIVVVGVGYLVQWVPLRLTRAEGPAFVRLRNILNWWSTAAMLATLGVASGHAIWLVGASIVASGAIWNTYSESVLKPALASVATARGRRAIWGAPILIEESPSLVILGLVLLFYPFPLGSIAAADLKDLFRQSWLLLLFGWLGLLLLALQVANLGRDEISRTAMARLLHGASWLTGAALLSGFVATRMPGVEVVFDLRILARPQEAGGIAPATLPGLLAWTLALSMAVGVVPTLAMLVSVVTRAPRFDVFISFASADSERARELDAAATRQQLRPFYSERTIEPGDPYEETIHAAIRGSAEMVALMTPNSHAHPWVLHEASVARALGKRVVPVLDGLSIEQLPADLRHLSAIPVSQIDAHFADLARQLGRRGWTQRGGYAGVR